jgi:N-methylhydantoinase A
MTEQSYQLGVDIGGTFTDAVAVSDGGEILRAKSATTHGEYTRGVLDAATKIASQLGVSLEQLLGRTTAFVNGTTIATNAVAELRGRPTGLLVTSGFEATLKIARRPKISAVDPHVQTPMPMIVPRENIVPINERITRGGVVTAELDLENVGAGVEYLVEERGIEALAISYLWSFANDVHEERTERWVRDRYPDVYVARSSLVYPVIREYERMLTTVLNCFVSDVVDSYVNRLEEDLRSSGFTGSFELGQSTGGVIDAEEARLRPLSLYNSGPVGGVTGAARVSEHLGQEYLLTADMGGTSFDVSLIRDARPALGVRARLGRFETGLSAVDVTAIGAGGGSICWVDERGAPRVGPESAGSQPGPVCYGRGGVEPTVTDICAVLGLVDPDFFLGGTMRLDVESAREAVEEKLVSRLGGEGPEVAAKMYEVISETMVGALRRVSLQRGHDPRKLDLFGYGGASGLFLGEVAKRSGIGTVRFPAIASAFSAYGLLCGDATRSSVRTVNWRVEEDDLEILNRTFSELQEGTVAKLAVGYPRERIDVEFQVDMQFAGQVFDVTVDIPAGQLSEESRGDLVARLRDRYGELYGKESVWEGFPVIVVNARVTARTDRGRPPLPTMTTAGPDDAEPRSRPIWFPAAATWREVDVYMAAAIDGAAITGPAVFEEVDTTIVVPDRATLERDELGNLVMKVTR